MTNEKALKDMQELIAKYGFSYECELTCEGKQVFTRRWEKTTEVVWYGKSKSTLEIKISMSCGIPLVRIFRDGRRDDRVRDYSSPKRAFNAIREIVSCAGFEM